MADLLGVAQRVPARVGQGDGVADAVKELGAHFLFQLLNLKRDGGLGIAQLFARTGEAAQLGDFYKNTQCPKVHGCPPGIKKINELDLIHQLDLYRYLLYTRCEFCQEV